MLWAESARRADCIETARRILVAAAERIAGDADLHYTLASYEVLLGDFDAVKGQLKQSFAIDPSLRQRALNDSDMLALWDSL
jgi:hypothetical protein